MTPTEFQAWFPSGEFASLDDDYVQVFITRAAPAFNVIRWGAWYSEGLANYVAHSIVADKARAAAAGASALEPESSGLVSSKGKGPVKVAYDSEFLRLLARDSFMATPYGRRYCELRRFAGLGGMVMQ